MVASITRLGILVSLLAILTASQAKAEGILEQIQREIVDIATRTRSAVVTVEDARALVAAYDTTPLAKKEIETKIAQREQEKKDSDSELGQYQQRYKAGIITQSELELEKVKNQRATLLLEIEQTKLKALGAISQAEQQKQDTINQVSLLQIDRRGLDIQIGLYESLKHAGTPDDPQLMQARLDRSHVEKRLAVLNRDLANTMDGKSTGTDSDPIAGAPIPMEQKPYVEPPRSGTGFSIGDGYIVTTADVLKGMSSPIVVTDSGDKLRAELVGMDSDLNIGLVKLQATITIPALNLGDSDQVVPGYFAISIGNQNGQTNSISLNLVAGVQKYGSYSSRNVHFYPSLIEIGGTIGAGSSGSPLVDVKGDVIGILVAIPLTPTIYTNPMQTSNTPSDDVPANTALPFSGFQPTPSPAAGGGPSRQAVESSVPLNGFEPDWHLEGEVSPPSVKPGLEYRPLKAHPQTDMPNATTFPGAPGGPPGGFQTFAFTSAVSSAGYAVPINVLKPVIEELRFGKSVKRSWIGIATADQEHASEKDGVIHIDHTVKVSGVYPDSPAQKEGIQPGDQLLTLGDTPIHETADVRSVVLRLRSGQMLKACVKRNGEVKNYLLSIQPKPESPKPPITEPIKSSF